MAGHSIITASGLLGVEDKPQRIYGFVLQSKAAAAGRVIFHNGDAAADGEIARADGVADSQVVVTYGAGGKFFPDGCYVEIDGNVQYVGIDYEQVQS